MRQNAFCECGAIPVTAKLFCLSMLYLAATALFTALAGAGSARAGEDPGYLIINAGAFDFHRDTSAAQFGAQYRMGERLWIIKPVVGIFGTSDGAVYGYGGFGIDLYFGKCKCVIFTPDFAVGYFDKGDGKDLGNEVEFRSGGEISYRFKDRSRIGIAIHHLSNASLSDSNPGEESFMANYSIPINWIVGD
jgi:hypothetical protein|tara:strand:- start:230 stop:802 length:573 start_codon:yes stop_codon:yes gene_type:complete